MHLMVSLAELDVVCVGANLVVSVAFGLVFAQVVPWRGILTDVLACRNMKWMSRSDVIVSVECTRGVELGVVRLISGSVCYSMVSFTICFGRLGQLTVSCGGYSEFALDLSTYGEVMWLSYSYSYQSR